MKRSKLLGILPLSFALACGGAVDPDQIHEKEGSDEDALLSGWEILANNVQSAHPLANNLNQTLEVVAPDTSRKFRIRFAQIRMEDGYDFLSIRDQWGTEVERITGNHRGYVSRTIQGNRAQLVLATDAGVRSWGFSINQIRHRGCVHNTPGAATLDNVSTCGGLRDEIRDLATQEVRRRFTEGHFGGPIIAFRGTAAEGAAAAAPAHSETNTQVRGVDEADLVKTDGNFIYTVAGRQLRIFRSWPAAQTELLHSINIEGFPSDLFLHNGRVVVLSGVQGERFSWVPGRPIPFALRMPIWWRSDAFTKVTVINVSGVAPTVESETLLAGQYNTARRIGNAIRLVLDRELVWPNIQYYPEGVEWNSPAFDAAMDQLESDAVQMVHDRVLADWLPKSYRVVNGQRVLLPTDCSDFSVPSNNEQMGLTSIVTINIGSATPSVQESSLLVDGEQVYQSLSNLYLTSSHRWSCYEDAGTEGQFTYVHKVDVTNPAHSTYLASGGFPGHIEDQFSMDEHQGHLRVAATNQKWSAPTPAQQSVSRVFVLRQVSNHLNIVGQTADMAPGERIFGARFIEDRGFVVTFRQVDPLFTLDLSVPTNPRVVGELKVPGFSTYLHPLDADHLFTIGNDFEADGTTRNGVALSIFNVSNLAAPRLVHKALIGSTSGHSEALYDHKAFTMFREAGHGDAVLAIPFTDYVNRDAQNFWGSFVSSLKVFRVSPLGILGLGELTHGDLFQSNQSKDFGWWYMPNIRRGVFVENFVYAISDAGLKVAETANLTNVVAAISAPAQYEDPTPPQTTISDRGEAQPNVSIPDNSGAGVSSSIELSEELLVDMVNIQVEIRHTYRGDLEVTIEHDGTLETLHNRTGGAANDVVQTFSTERFTDRNSKGIWTLRVKDLAASDVGRLVSWSVEATGRAPSGSTVPPAPVILSRSYENNSRMSIPDNLPRGVNSTIDVVDGISIGSLELTVDITHTYRGDLRVILEHDGVTAMIHDMTGGSQNDLQITTALDGFDGHDARGTWTLRVSDHAGSDIGTLNSWRLALTGEQLN